MEAKDLVYNADGSITCEIDHPVFGWIPCTVSKDDEATKDIFADCLAGKYGDIAPNPAPNLGDLKNAKNAEINAARAAAIDAGVEYGGHTWDSDETSRVNLTGLLVSLQAGTPLPDGFTWRTADNVDVPLTAAQFVEFGTAMLDHLNTQYRKSWALKAQVDAAQTVGEVEAIGWS